MDFPKVKRTAVTAAPTQTDFYCSCTSGRILNIAAKRKRATRKPMTIFSILTRTSVSIPKWRMNHSLARPMNELISSVASRRKAITMMSPKEFARSRRYFSQAFFGAATTSQSLFSVFWNWKNRKSPRRSASESRRFS